MESSTLEQANFEIIPYERAGPVRFGMSRGEVSAALGTLPIEEFRRTAEAEPTEVYADGAVQINYDGQGRCEAVEFADPKIVRPVIDGFGPLGEPYSEVESFLRQRDPQLDIDDAGLTSLKLGIGVYAPTATDRAEAPTESVIAFVKNYYS